jgi:hypothetical protein
VAWRAWPADPGPAAPRAEVALEPVAERPARRASAPEQEATRVAVAAGEREGDRAALDAGATLDAHVRWGGDGLDAAGIRLVVYPHADERPDLRARRGATDAGGRARFEGLAPGPYWLYTDRGGRTEVALSSGETRALAVVLAAGVDVDGVVVDGAGRPVPDAEIWLSRNLGAGWLAGEVAARAGPAGEFFLRSVAPEQAVGAFAPGFAPCLLEALREKRWPADDPRLRLTLVLERAGASLEGRVLDPTRAPVASALVAFGGAGIALVPRAEGGFGQVPTPRAVVTDELGRFRADGLEPGSILVSVLAEGFPIACVEATASAASAEFLEVVLERGVTISGIVRDPAGRPAPARIRASTAGEVQGGCPFSLPGTRSGADGAFALELVTRGAITLSAKHDSDERLRARVTRSIPDGTLETWDIVLEEAPHIAGRAVDGDGQGLARWKLKARSGSVSTGLETDDEGRFVLVVREPAEAWTLELVRESTVHDRAEDVRAGDEVVLVGRREEELGRIAGAFSDVAGRVPPGERVSARLMSEDTAEIPSADLVDGRFAFEAVSPGKYRVDVLTAALVLARSDWFDLAPGTSLDIGLLASRMAGSLLVEFTVPPGCTLPEEGAYVSGPMGETWRSLVRRDGSWRMDGLNPGRHALTTFFPSLALQHGSFEVQEGLETRLTVVLERGAERRLAFVPPPGRTCRSADVFLRLEGWELSLPVFGMERPELTLCLAPGRYELEASACGLSARGAFDVPDGSLEPAELAFELR